MRGGTFTDSYRFPGKDFADFVRAHSITVHASHQQWLEKLPESLALDQLHREVAKLNDVHLSRLAHEYLPLSFSRRHGDPSRPWNRFDIHIKDEQGRPLYAYQGNWRDIFQNWESLAQSYPAWLEQMISVFLNASTADGYNPYRITRNGVDWEISDPRIPGATSVIGVTIRSFICCAYLKVRNDSNQANWPTNFARKPAFTRMCRMKSTASTRSCADPRHTITFNHSLHQLLMSRARELGADGKLLTDDRGEIVLVSLAEKLLVPLLVKLSNFVPGGWHLAQHTATRMERRQQRACRLGFVHGHRVPPPPLPQVLWRDFYRKRRQARPALRARRQIARGDYLHPSRRRPDGRERGRRCGTLPDDGRTRARRRSPPTGPFTRAERTTAKLFRWAPCAA